MTLTLRQALEEGRLAEFAAQAEAEGIGPADCNQFETMLGRVTVPNQKVKHPVHPFAVVRAESELEQIALHVLGADLDMG